MHATLSYRCSYDKVFPRIHICKDTFILIIKIQYVTVSRTIYASLYLYYECKIQNSAGNNVLSNKAARWGFETQPMNAEDYEEMNFEIRSLSAAKQNLSFHSIS